MKNIKILYLLIIAVSLTFTACDNVDFGTTNIDPNSPSAASTGSLFTNAQETVGTNYSSATIPNMYVQYLSNGQYPEESQYQTLNFSFDGTYAVLTDLQKVIQLNTDEATKVAAQANGSNANQIAASKILRVYYFHMMTDRWGMIPYTEALQGLDNPFPIFDSQQTIYNGLFTEIDAALAMIDGGNGPAGDIMFSGDMDMWRIFGNTIKMTMALRLAKADPTTGSAKFNEALGKVISSNSENIKYTFLPDDNNDNPWQDRFETRKDYIISDVFADALVGNGSSTAPEDPRFEKYADDAELKPGQYLGAPYGQGNPGTDNYSFITSDIIYTSESSLMVYTYAEMLFARAEAAAMSWTNEDPAALFAEAIAASMDQWGVAPAAANTYVSNHPYGGVASIARERWKAQFLQGYNSWADWRRSKAMGFGVVLNPPTILLSNATDIPDRHAYSATADALNEDNYNAAVAAQGPDILNTKLWLFK